MSVCRSHGHPKPTMKQNYDIGEMIQNELDRIDHSPAWLANQLKTCRSNGYKIIRDRKYNDILFLIDVSLATNHNFFRDIAAQIDDELSNNTVQKESPLGTE